MKVAVMGAGAVGCYYGAMFARAGHEVTLIGRAPHVQAMARGGLRLETASFDERLSVHASEEASAVQGARLVLFCVKSGDTESAGRDIAAHLDADALVLSLQNGVDNAPRLQALLRQSVVPAVVYVATEIAGPGHVRHHGRGELVLGPQARRDDVLQVFASANVPIQISDNVVGALWAKLIVNCAYNALSAIAQMPYGQLVQGEGIAATMQDVVHECLAVAGAMGIVIPGDMPEAVRGIARSMPGQQSSTAQDLARGRRTEIDQLNGYVIRQGELHGVPTPVNRVLHGLVKLLESREKQV
jgi:2-dehydropantoate 2-reductase